MRRLAAVVVAAAVLVALPQVAEAETVPTGEPWGGSHLEDPAPITAPTTEISVGGWVQNNGNVTYSRPAVTVTFDGNPETGCDVAPDGPAVTASMGSADLDNRLPPRWKRYSYAAEVPFAPTSNGTYPLFVCINGLPRIRADVLVRLPAPTVTNLVAAADGHAVDLSWDDMRGAAPDLSGYRVERSIGDGSFTALETVGADATTYRDTSLPAAGGKATYRVIALRPLVGEAAASNSAQATFAAAPTDTTGGGGSGTGGGSGGTGGGGTGGGGSTGGTGSSGGGAGGPAIGGRSSIRVPRVGTPSRNFFPPLLAPPVDTGFSEELPFEDVEPGEDDPVLPDDELAVADVPLPGRGLAVPFATGLVLAVWALHLRFLARAARPEYAEPIEIL